MRRFSGTELSSAEAGLSILFKAIFSLPILVGGTLYVIGFGAWLLVLTRLEVSVAYPMLSINYILITIVAWLFLGEPLNGYKLAGCLLIMAGVIVLSRGIPAAPKPQAVAPPAMTSPSE
ncbi:MAG: EamA family transporter [Bdellovibrionota bacterium]